MTSSEWAAFAAVSAIAALALLMYWCRHRAARRARLTQAYTEALATIAAYEELPYRIRRRSGDDYRAELGRRISDVRELLFFHETRLTLGSPAVGGAYRDLVARTRDEGVAFRKDAWSRSIAADDADMHFQGKYVYTNAEQRDRCVEAMRRELNRWSLFD